MFARLAAWNTITEAPSSTTDVAVMERDQGSSFSYDLTQKLYHCKNDASFRDIP